MSTYDQQTQVTMHPCWTTDSCWTTDRGNEMQTI